MRFWPNTNVVRDQYFGRTAQYRYCRHCRKYCCSALGTTYVQYSHRLHPELWLCGETKLNSQPLCWYATCTLILLACIRDDSDRVCANTIADTIDCNCEWNICPNKVVVTRWGGLETPHSRGRARSGWRLAGQCAPDGRPNYKTVVPFFLTQWFSCVDGMVPS